MKNFVVILACVLLIALCAVLYLYLRLKKSSKNAYIDLLTGALTENGFYKYCHSVVGNESSRFAIVSMQISNIGTLLKAQSGTEYENFIRFICESINKGLREDELISRAGDGIFCFLIRNRRETEIIAKLNSISDRMREFNENTHISNCVYPLFGVYLPESDEESATELFRKAEIARLDASEKNRVIFYDSTYDEKLKKGREIASSIQNALDSGEITVHYQPKVRISDERVVGAEALVRWRHPLRGMLSPNMFLPVAEQYHLTDKIDRAVFAEVCRSVARRNAESYESCPISVNLSEDSLCRPGLADELYEICQAYDVSPSSIELEFKEKDVSKNRERVSILTERLHFYGFRCAIDNFGTGDCSLQLLGSVNIDTVKFDSSFFNGENDKRDGRHLIETVMKYSALLRIHTVAEGIDNYGQVEFLKNAACDVVQGFAYFKPMPLEKFEAESFDNGMLKYVSVNPAAMQSQKLRQLTASRAGDAMNSVILFVYRPTEDSISFSDPFSPVFKGQTEFENALALIRTTDLIHENDRKDFLELLERCSRENGWVSNTLRFHMYHGRYEWLEIRMYRDTASGTISGMLADMSGWKSEVNRWKEKAIRDALTGLYNRAYFEQNVKNILKQGNHDCASFIFVDVDNFKRVNDTYGHMFGDDVLCFVAKQILGIFRHTDIIARYGGDEFVIFAPSLDKTILEERLKKLLATLEFPYRSGTTEYSISVTLGASLYPRDGTDYDVLLEHADNALYEAKEQGKKRYVLYEPYMLGEQSRATTPIVSADEQGG